MWNMFPNLILSSLFACFVPEKVEWVEAPFPQGLSKHIEELPKSPRGSKRGGSHSRAVSSDNQMSSNYKERSSRSFANKIRLFNLYLRAALAVQFWIEVCTDLPQQSDLSGFCKSRYTRNASEVLIFPTGK